jgi:hypothetical protein
VCLLGLDQKRKVLLIGEAEAKHSANFRSVLPTANARIMCTMHLRVASTILVLAGCLTLVQCKRSHPAPLPKSGRTVSLTWKASTTPKVAYNLYRKTSSKAPYTLPIASGIKTLSYEDHVMAAPGEKFYYVVRAVDDAKRESLNSNEVEVVIPPR